MAKLPVGNELPSATDPFDNRQLCYEDGGVMIHLDGGSENCLLLHSAVLKRASMYFLPGSGSSKSTWDQNYSTIVKHPNSDKDARVYKYQLKCNQTDRIFHLQGVVSKPSMISQLCR